MGHSIVTDPTADSIRHRLKDHHGVRVTEPGRIEAAVAVVLAPATGGELQLLFIKRAAHRDDPWSGQMALPGGRREPADHSLEVTAVRETAEETGIDLAGGELIGVLDDLAPTTPVLPAVVVRPFVFALPHKPEVVPSPEVALHLWTPVATLPEIAREAKVTVRGKLMRVSAYCVGQHVVWGMTHRIIKGFLDLAV